MEIKVNLIPPQKKEEIQRSYWLRLVSKWEMEFVFLLIFFIVALVSINFILKTNIAAENSSEFLAEKNNDKYKLISDYDAEIRDVSAQLANVKKLQSNQLYWSKFLGKLNEKVVAGIEISSLLTSDYDITLSGQANTRDNLIAFKDSLAQDDCFASAELPLSNLVSKENVEFQLSLEIKKACLK